MEGEREEIAREMSALKCPASPGAASWFGCEASLFVFHLSCFVVFMCFNQLCIWIYESYISHEMQMMSAVLKERRDISGIATQQFSSCSLDSGYVPRGSMHCGSERWMAAVEVKLAETWALTVQVKCWKYNILYVAEQQRTSLMLVYFLIIVAVLFRCFA